MQQIKEEDLGKMKDYEEFVRSRSTIAEDGRKYAALGLSGESGEVFTDVLELLLAVTRANETVKKFLRNNDKEKYRAKIVSELGDVFFYMTKVGQEVEAGLSEIIEENIKKIDGRNRLGFTKG
jgi:NTP pyrophosphatase (non-canonical NTP hydrolase)